MNTENKTCPKCNGTNIWYHPENKDWNEFYYCPKCQFNITENEYQKHSVNEDGGLYDSLTWCDFEFADTPAQEQLFQHFYFPEVAEVHISPIEQSFTTTKLIIVHEQHVKALRDLLNRILEEIENNEN